ncbi:hypothetical protein ACFLSU_03650 [Bacteroidota bacterium]
MRKLLSFSKKFNRIYFSFMVVFLFFINTSYEINIAFVKYWLYLGVLIFTPILLICDIYIYRPKLKKIYRILSPLIAFVYVFLVGPVYIFETSTLWETEKVLFVNKENPDYKVEKQKQKLLGTNIYKTRTVEILHLTSFISKVEKYHKEHLDFNNWNKITD